ncbi:hypothetical protein R3P38DRAFT_1189027 [Favolaschia claudopus]|uniref:Uncharacterized protein n=1 Tax=Favolaschia claudopus TaxID=2862362 RepID=A0AAW0E259_9AGAR
MYPQQPLRDRCNVPTPVCTDTKKDGTLRSTKQASPHVNASSYHPPTSCDIEEVPRTPHDPYAPRQFVPYLYLSSPSHFNSQPPTGSWTHTLRLLPSSKTHPAGTVQSSSAAGPGSLTLDLRLPADAFKATSRVLHLTKDQLLLARDFLALALPYYASAHPPETPLTSSTGSGGWSPWSHARPSFPHALGLGLPPSGFEMQQTKHLPSIPRLSQADPVRVMVSGPPRLTLVIALLYIAYASGCSIAQVTRGVLEGDGDAEWRRLIAEDGGRLGLGRQDLGLLEQVALHHM